MEKGLTTKRAGVRAKKEAETDPMTGKAYKFDKDNRILNEDGTSKSKEETDEIIDNALRDWLKGGGLK
jgi:hypothetical protein